MRRLCGLSRRGLRRASQAEEAVVCCSDRDYACGAPSGIEVLSWVAVAAVVIGDQPKRGPQFAAEKLHRCCYKTTAARTAFPTEAPSAKDLEDGKASSGWRLLSLTLQPVRGMVIKKYFPQTFLDLTSRQMSAMTT